VFFRFQGGKGVATAAGVLLAINPLLGAASLATWAIIAAFFRYSSLASIVTAVFAPFYQALIWGVEPLLLALVGMSLLLIWRHSGNIRKLLAGTESKLGHKAAAAPAAAGHGHHGHGRHDHTRKKGH
jgi:glycerol-3-phosphate acyltransferase PlsY